MPDTSMLRKGDNMNMSEMKKQLQEALPDGLIVNEDVLEQIVGGVQTNMGRKEMDLLLAKAGIPAEYMPKLITAIAKPKPGPGGSTGSKKG